MEWTQTQQRIDVGRERRVVPAWQLEGMVGAEVFVLDVRSQPLAGYGTAFALVYDRGATMHPTLESALVAGEVVAPGVQLRELERRTETENRAREAARDAAVAYERLTGAGGGGGVSPATPDLEGLSAVQRSAARWALVRLVDMGADVEATSAACHVVRGVYSVDRPFGPERFTWGRVVAVHSVGGYQIVEFLRNVTGMYDPYRLKERPVTDELRFHPYVDGYDIGRSFGSLDSALLGVVAWRAEFARGGFNEAANSQSVTFMRRLLRMDD